MSYTDEQYRDELKTRLDNPAVSDIELDMYIASAKRDVTIEFYTANDYISQVLDTACFLLSLDNKFPEIASVSQNGVTTGFAANDAERWRRRVSERRQASLIGYDL